MIDTSATFTPTGAPPRRSSAPMAKTTKRESSAGVRHGPPTVKGLRSPRQRVPSAPTQRKPETSVAKRVALMENFGISGGSGNSTPQRYHDDQPPPAAATTEDQGAATSRPSTGDATSKRIGSASGAPTLSTIPSRRGTRPVTATQLRVEKSSTGLVTMKRRGLGSASTTRPPTTFGGNIPVLPTPPSPRPTAEHPQQTTPGLATLSNSRRRSRPSSSAPWPKCNNTPTFSERQNKQDAYTVPPPPPVPLEEEPYGSSPPRAAFTTDSAETIGEHHAFQHPTLQALHLNDLENDPPLWAIGIPAAEAGGHDDAFAANTSWLDERRVLRAAHDEFIKGELTRATIAFQKQLQRVMKEAMEKGEAMNKKWDMFHTVEERRYNPGTSRLPRSDPPGPTILPKEKTFVDLSAEKKPLPPRKPPVPSRRDAMDSYRVSYAHHSYNMHSTPSPTTAARSALKKSSAFDQASALRKQSTFCGGDYGDDNLGLPRSSRESSQESSEHQFISVDDGPLSSGHYPFGAGVPTGAGAFGSSSSSIANVSKDDVLDGGSSIATSHRYSGESAISGSGAMPSKDAFSDGSASMSKSSYAPPSNRRGTDVFVEPAKTSPAHPEPLTVHIGSDSGSDVFNSGQESVLTPIIHHQQQTSSGTSPQLGTFSIPPAILPTKQPTSPTKERKAVTFAPLSGTHSVEDDELNASAPFSSSLLSTSSHPGDSSSSSSKHSPMDNGLAPAGTISAAAKSKAAEAQAVQAAQYKEQIVVLQRQRSSLGEAMNKQRLLTEERKQYEEAAVRRRKEALLKELATTSRMFQPRHTSSTSGGGDGGTGTSTTNNSVDDSTMDDLECSTTSLEASMSTTLSLSLSVSPTAGSMTRAGRTFSDGLEESFFSDLSENNNKSSANSTAPTPDIGAQLAVISSTVSSKNKRMVHQWKKRKVVTSKLNKKLNAFNEKHNKGSDVPSPVVPSNKRSGGAIPKKVSLDVLDSPDSGDASPTSADLGKLNAKQVAKKSFFTTVLSDTLQQPPDLRDVIQRAQDTITKNKQTLSTIKMKKQHEKMLVKKEEKKQSAAAIALAQTKVELLTKNFGYRPPTPDSQSDDEEAAPQSKVRGQKPLVTPSSKRGSGNRRSQLKFDKSVVGGTSVQAASPLTVSSSGASPRNFGRGSTVFVQKTDVAVQNTLEDELNLYRHQRTAALLKKERLMRRLIRSMQVALANITAFWRGVDVDLTCLRCCQPMWDPVVLSPCGTTICRTCLVADDEEADTEVFGRECGCGFHEGYINNDAAMLISDLHNNREEGAATAGDGAIQDIAYGIQTLLFTLGIDDVDDQEQVEAAVNETLEKELQAREVNRQRQAELDQRSKKKNSKKEKEREKAAADRRVAEEQQLAEVIESMRHEVKKKQDAELLEKLELATNAVPDAVARESRHRIANSTFVSHPARR